MGLFDLFRKKSDLEQLYESRLNLHKDRVALYKKSGEHLKLKHDHVLRKAYLEADAATMDNIHMCSVMIDELEQGRQDHNYGEKYYERSSICPEDFLGGPSDTEPFKPMLTRSFRHVLETRSHFLVINEKSVWDFLTAKGWRLSHKGHELVNVRPNGSRFFELGRYKMASNVNRILGKTFDFLLRDKLRKSYKRHLSCFTHLKERGEFPSRFDMDAMKAHIDEIYRRDKSSPDCIYAILVYTGLILKTNITSEDIYCSNENTPELFDLLWNQKAMELDTYDFGLLKDSDLLVFSREDRKRFIENIELKFKGTES